MVAMSGGVDSSVAACLLREQGHGLAGMFMKNWEEDDRLGTCTAEQDAADAERVAARLGIELHKRNFAAEYWDNVFEVFLSEYRAGRTPNPDILCNREIKFKTFLEHASDLGATEIATGHYARIDRTGDRCRLLRAQDVNKDQSYFLYAVGHEQLARTRFPLGELDKAEVRALARDAGLAVHDKKDSTGICFIGERDFRSFLAQYIDSPPGPIRTPEGHTLGEHDGLPYYTLGQRQGLGLGGQPGWPEGAWYVLHKDTGENTLYVGQGHEHPWLFSTLLRATDLSWVGTEPPPEGSRLAAKVRYRQPDQQCTLLRADENNLLLRFDRPQRAVTPGQSVVLYRDDECLGGGVIDRMNAPPSRWEESA